jgi:flagellar transcriptional activator FlhD
MLKWICNEMRVISDRKTLDSIREPNSSYLLLAQRMLYNDHAAAMVQLGLWKDLAAIVFSLTLGQIVKLAAFNQLLCFPLR